MADGQHTETFDIAFKSTGYEQVEGQVKSLESKAKSGIKFKVDMAPGKMFGQFDPQKMVKSYAQTVEKETTNLSNKLEKSANLRNRSVGPQRYFKDLLDEYESNGYALNEIRDYKSISKEYGPAKGKEVYKDLLENRRDFYNKVQAMASTLQPKELDDLMTSTEESAKQAQAMIKEAVVGSRAINNVLSRKTISHGRSLKDVVEDVQKEYGNYVSDKQYKNYRGRFQLGGQSEENKQRIKNQVKTILKDRQEITSDSYYRTLSKEIKENQKKAAKLNELAAKESQNSKNPLVREASEIGKEEVGYLKNKYRDLVSNSVESIESQITSTISKFNESYGKMISEDGKSFKTDVLDKFANDSNFRNSRKGLTDLAGSIQVMSDIVNQTDGLKLAMNPETVSSLQNVSENARFYDSVIGKAYRQIGDESLKTTEEIQQIWKEQADLNDKSKLAIYDPKKSLAVNTTEELRRIYGNRTANAKNDLIPEGNSKLRDDLKNLAKYAGIAEDIDMFLENSSEYNKKFRQVNKDLEIPDDELYKGEHAYSTRRLRIEEENRAKLEEKAAKDERRRLAKNQKERERYYRNKAAREAQTTSSEESEESGSSFSSGVGGGNNKKSDDESKKTEKTIVDASKQIQDEAGNISDTIVAGSKSTQKHIVDDNKETNKQAAQAGQETKKIWSSLDAFKRDNPDVSDDAWRNAEHSEKGKSLADLSGLEQERYRLEIVDAAEKFAANAAAKVTADAGAKIEMRMDHEGRDKYYVTTGNATDFIDFMNKAAAGGLSVKEMLANFKMDSINGDIQHMYGNSADGRFGTPDGTDNKILNGLDVKGITESLETSLSRLQLTAPVEIATNGDGSIKAAITNGSDLWTKSFKNSGELTSLVDNALMGSSSLEEARQAFFASLSGAGHKKVASTSTIAATEQEISKIKQLATDLGTTAEVSKSKNGINVTLSTEDGIYSKTVKSTKDLLENLNKYADFNEFKTNETGWSVKPNKPSAKTETQRAILSTDSRDSLTKELESVLNDFGLSSKGLKIDKTGLLSGSISDSETGQTRKLSKIDTNTLINTVRASGAQNAQTVFRAIEELGPYSEIPSSRRSLSTKTAADVEQMKNSLVSMFSEKDFQLSPENVSFTTAGNVKVTNAVGNMNGTPTTFSGTFTDYDSLVKGLKSFDGGVQETVQNLKGLQIQKTASPMFAEAQRTELGEQARNLFDNIASDLGVTKIKRLAMNSDGTGTLSANFKRDDGLFTGTYSIKDFEGFVKTLGSLDGMDSEGIRDAVMAQMTYNKNSERLIADKNRANADDLLNRAAYRTPVNTNTFSEYQERRIADLNNAVNRLLGIDANGKDLSNKSLLPDNLEVRDSTGAKVRVGRVDLAEQIQGQIEMIQNEMSKEIAKRSPESLGDVNRMSQLYEDSAASANFLANQGVTALNNYMANKYGDSYFKLAGFDGSVFERGAAGIQEMEKAVSSMLESQGFKNIQATRTKDGVSTFTYTDQASNRRVTAKYGYEVADNGADVVAKEKGVASEPILSTGQRIMKSASSKIRSIGEYFVGIKLVQGAFDQLNQGMSFIKTLDSSLTNINMTMGVTQQQLKALGEGAIQTGIDLSSNAENVLNAISIYANKMETPESILEKTKPTIMLSNAEGVDSTVASSQLQAITNQFKSLKGGEIEAANSLEVISANLAMDFASGITDMAEGIKNAGSVAEASGLSMQLFASMIGKVAEVTRTDGSSIGNLMKTTFSRISRSSDADAETSLADRSKAAKAFHSVGIDLYDKNGMYQDLTVTLDQLSAKWAEMTDAEQNYIAESAAGTRGINIFRTIMDNYNEIKHLTALSMSDDDFIYETQEKWENSLEGASQRLKARVQKIWSDTITSGMATGAVDFTSTLVGGLGTLINGTQAVFKNTVGLGGAMGGLSDLLAFTGTLGTLGLGAFKLLDTKSQVSKAVKNRDPGTSMLSAAAEAIRVDFGWTKKIFGKDGTIAKSFSFVKDATKGATARGWNAMKETFTAAKSFATGKTNLADTLTNLRTGIAAANAASGVSSLGQGAFAGILGKLGTVLPWVAGIAAVGGLAYTAYQQSDGQVRKRANSKNEAYKQEQATIATKGAWISQNSDKIADLEKGINLATGENISNTAEEMEQYKSIMQEAAQMFPDTISAFNEQGIAIVREKSALDAITEAYRKEALASAEENIKNAGAYTDAYKTYDDRYKYVNPQGQVKTHTAGGITDIQKLSALKGSMNLNEDELRFALAGEFGDFTQRQIDYLKDVLKNTPVNAENMNKVREQLDQAYQTIDEGVSDVVSAYSGLLDSYVNSQRYSGTKPKGLEEKDWNNLSSLMKRIDVGQITSLMNAEIDPKDYIQNWVDALSYKDVAKDLDTVNSLTADTNVVDMVKTVDGALARLEKRVEGFNSDGLLASLGITDYDTIKSQYEQIKRNFIGGNFTPGMDVTTNALRNLYGSDDKFENGYFGRYTTYDGKGGAKSIVYTPVTEDGEVLTGDSLRDYMQKIVDGGEDVKDLVIAEFDGKNAIRDSKKLTDQLKKARAETKKNAGETDKFNDALKKLGVSSADDLSKLSKALQKYNGDLEAVMKNWSAEIYTPEGEDKRLQDLEDNLTRIENYFAHLNDARAAAYSSSGMKLEDVENIQGYFEDLDDFNYDKLFESTAAGIKMNAKELRRLNKEWQSKEAERYQNEVDGLVSTLKNYNEEIANAADGTDAERLRKERAGVLQDLAEAQQLQSIFEGMTNGVYQWELASSGAEAGDTWDRLSSTGLKSGEERYKRHEIGTNEFRSLANLFVYDDLTDAPVEDIVSAYEDNIETIKSWFKTNATDGSPVEGLNNFLLAAQAVDKGMARLDPEGNWHINEAGLQFEEFAKKMDIDSGLLQTIFDKLGDMGFDINFDESTYAFDQLKTEAQKVFDSLDENTKKKYDIDLDVSSASEVDTQIETINKALSDPSLGEEAKTKLREIREYLFSLKDKNITIGVEYQEKDVKDDALNRLSTFNKAFGTDYNVEYGSHGGKYYDEQIENAGGSVLQSNGGKLLSPSDSRYTAAKGALEDLMKARDELSRSDFYSADLKSMGLNDGEYQVIQAAYQKLVDSVQEYNRDLEMGKYLDIPESAIDSARESVLKAKDALGEFSPEKINKLQEMGFDLEIPMDEVQQQYFDAETKVKEFINGETVPEVTKELNAKYKITTDFSSEDGLIATLAKLDEGQRKQLLIDIGVGKDEVDAYLAEKDPEIQAHITVSKQNLESHDPYAAKILSGGNIDPVSIPIIAQWVMGGSPEDLTGYTDKEQAYIIHYQAERSALIDAQEQIAAFGQTLQAIPVGFKVDYQSLAQITNGNISNAQMVMRVIADPNDLAYINSLTPEQKEIAVKYITNQEEIDGWTPEQKEAMVKWLSDTSDPDGYRNTNIDKFPTVTYRLGSVPNVDGLFPNINRTVNYTVRQNGSGASSPLPRLSFNKSAFFNGNAQFGSAYANGNVKESVFDKVKNKIKSVGSALASGTIGAIRSGKALVGELGPELRVRGNKFFMLGQHGAEMTDVRKGDIIFNHKFCGYKIHQIAGNS